MARADPTEPVAETVLRCAHELPPRSEEIAAEIATQVMADGLRWSAPVRDSAPSRACRAPTATATS